MLIQVSFLLWTGQASSSETNQWCDYQSGMCMAINIPSTTASDYYLSITAPHSVGYPLCLLEPELIL